MYRVKYHNQSASVEDKIVEFSTLKEAKAYIEAHGGDDYWADGKYYITASEGRAYFEII